MPATPRKLRFTEAEVNFTKRLSNRDYQTRIIEQMRADGLHMHDLVETALSEPEWIIDGWLVDDMGLLIAGDPKSYKSTMAFDLMAALAYSQPFLGLYEVRADKQPVIYLHEENTAKDVRRHSMELLHRMGHGTIHKFAERGKYGQTKENRVWTPGSDTLWDGVVSLVRTRSGFKVDEEWLDELRDVVLREGIKWIFLDPLYKIQTEGAGLNDDKAIAHITRSLDALAEETHSNIVLIHHNNKSRGASGGHKIMGSNLIHGWAPQLWQIQREEDVIMNGETVRKVTVSPDFRSLAPQWVSKTLLYHDWAAWTEAGEYLPGEKRTVGRPAHPRKAEFLEKLAAGEIEGTSQRGLARIFGVGRSTIQDWMKEVADDPDEL